MTYTPDRSELHHLYNNPTMQWALKRIGEQYRPMPPHQIAKSWEAQHRLVGQQEVLHSLHKLMNPE